MSIDPVELRPEQSFQAERWVRFIRECQDIEQLRDTAMALVQQLTQQKAANVWMASRASESENEKLEVKLSVKDEEIDVGEELIKARLALPRVKDAHGGLGHLALQLC